MINENWYYRCNLLTLIAENYQQIPDTCLNMTGLKDLSDSELADLSWSGNPIGFLSKTAATALGIDANSMTLAETNGAGVVYAFAKIGREKAVAQITVTTTSGRVFDGDEKSQERMARAAFVMKEMAVATTPWKLANNEVATVTIAELVEALALAGTAQTNLWMI